VADAMDDDRSAQRSPPSKSAVGDEPPAPVPQDSTQAGRRRRRTILIVCVLVVVALIGVIAVLTSSTPDSRGSHPVLSQAQLEAVAASAGRVLERERLPGFRMNVAVTAETRGAKQGLSHAGSSPQKWSKGQEFEVAALCMGRGSVTVQWQAPGEVTGELPVVCSEGGKSASVRFTPLADGQLIQFTLHPDDEAVGRAGMAIGVIEFQ
jgi:hypothetical protein